jgi:hypothetical protein
MVLNIQPVTDLLPVAIPAAVYPPGH